MNANEIRSMSREDLLALNKQVVAEIRHRDAMKQVAAAASFREGDIVAFSTKRGFVVRGRVIGINTKSVSVQEINSEGADVPFKSWRVAPTLLRAAAL